jgi:hypothetical protein
LLSLHLLSLGLLSLREYDEAGRGQCKYEHAQQEQA